MSSLDVGRAHLDRGPEHQLHRREAATGDPLHLRRLLRRPPPPCPTPWRGQRCKRWTCPTCRIALAQEERQAVERGLLDAFRQGLAVQLLTVTDASVIPLDLPPFNAGWKRLRDNLGRAGLAPDHFVSILDYNSATRSLHRHVLAAGGPALTPRILQEHAQRAGLGHIDRQAVEPTARSARDLAAYVAKNALHFAVVFTESPGPIRPISRSRN